MAQQVIKFKLDEETYQDAKQKLVSLGKLSKSVYIRDAWFERFVCFVLGILFSVVTYLLGWLVI